MKTFLSALVLSLLFALPARAELKIAYVDMQRALLEVDAGRQAAAKLAKMKQQRQRDLDAEQQALQQLHKSFEKQKAFMKAQVRNEKELELRNKLAELQAKFGMLQRELATEEAKLTKGIFERMVRIIAAMGEAEGNIIFLEKTESSLLWAPKSYDRTTELIRRFNKGEGAPAPRR